LTDVIENTRKEDTLKNAEHKFTQNQIIKIKSIPADLIRLTDVICNSLSERKKKEGKDRYKEFEQKLIES